ncbi:MAG: marine proteobacterial sortase target protein [Gammaproteobacteria bacterium]|nr:marine proteobacterial sortase target protein [Gammaproteobacteria bacterium]MCW8924311.1 marine proteobacterial sortase target protein [Gammaproteobacteria bacterium]
MKHKRELFYSYDRPQKQNTLLIRVLVLVVIFMVFLLVANKVYANGESTRPDLNSVTRGTAWLLPSNGVYIEALQLQSKVNINVSGMIARATVKQQFRNTSSLWAEGLYVFPLPENAAVDHFRLLIDGRIIEGQIQEKQQARKTYETAKRQGKRTGLVEQQRPNIFTTKLANISPGAEMSVEIEYQQTLQYRDGRYSLRYPLVVGERFITPSKEGAGNVQYDLGVYTFSSTTSKNLNQNSITVNLDTGISVANIVSDSHPVVISPQTDNRYTINLRDTNVPADRDFLLSWTPELGKLPKATVFNQKHDGYEYSLITVYPPKNELYNLLDIPRDVVFILDVSGSMSGASIEQAKSALMLALDRLKSSDKFNIVWFNNVAKKIFFESRLASNANINEAKNFVRSLSAGGGTMMMPALQLALESNTDPDYLRQTIFITDGNVSNERDLFEYIKSNLADNRLFTVGIGSAPNSFFMKKAAKAGRGTFTFISNIREVGKKSEALFRKLEMPALTDIKMELFGDDIEYYHDPIPDLYIGEPVTVLLRGKNIFKEIVVKGDIGSNQWQHKVFLNQGSDNDGVRVAWAREKIAALTQSHYDENNGVFKEHLKMQILEESIKHHLVSRFTSLVAVDVTPVNQTGALHSERMTNNLPYGWTRSDNKVAKSIAPQINLPQTGAGLYAHIMFALLFITAGLMLRFMNLSREYK